MVSSGDIIDVMGPGHDVDDVPKPTSSPNRQETQVGMMSMTSMTFYVVALKKGPAHAPR